MTDLATLAKRVETLALTGTDIDAALLATVLTSVSERSPASVESALRACNILLAAHATGMARQFNKPDGEATRAELRVSLADVLALMRVTMELMEAMLGERETIN